MVHEWTWTPRKVRPIATYALIAVNIIMYFASSYQNYFAEISNEWVDTFSYVPILMINPLQWYRVITSMFLHGDLFHIFFNMLFLYWFGREIELLLGMKKYLALYIVSGISATIFHTAFTPIVGSISLITPALGASGAISGLLGAYLLTYPRRRLSLCWFFFFVPLCFTTTAAFFLLFWFATQVIYGYLRFGGIAFFAHVGGFIAGLSLVYVLKKRKVYQYTPWTLITPIPFEHGTVRGLGKVTKFVLSILLLAVLSGAIYSLYIAPQASSVYNVKISACSKGTCETDEGVYTPINGENISPSKDLPRIAFNRIVWSNIIQAPSTRYCNAENIEISRSVRVQMPGTNVAVDTVIKGIGSYDDKCVLVKFDGQIDTYVINIRSIFGITIAERGERLLIDNVELVSQDVAGDTGKYIVRPLALISSIITFSSVFIVVSKDRDIVEEEFPYIPPHIPWI